MNRLLFILLVFPSLLFAQQQEIKSVQAQSPIINLLSDRAGDFYVTLESGAILKFNKNGNEIGEFARANPPTLFDPSNAIRLLTYYREAGEYTWLSPDLGFREMEKIDPVLAIEPIFICPSGERFMWILDGADYSFKKVDPTVPRVINEFILKDEPEIKTIREYQNFLFVLEPEGIRVYNTIGIELRRLPVTGLEAFNFLGEELYYLKGDKIIFFNLFTTQGREVPLSRAADQVVLTDERMVLTEGNQIRFYEFNP